MAAALNKVNELKHISGAYPEITFKMGTLALSGETAEFKITNEEYVPLIERGDVKGKYVPQIQTLGGVDGLLVQGSTIMSSLYTVFDYGIRMNPTIVDIELYPIEMRAYNRKNGPEIIQPDFFSSKTATLESNDVLESNGISVYPNPLRGNLHINLTSASEDLIQIRFTDFAGRLIYETSRKAKKGANLFNLKNSIKDPKNIQQKMVILSITNESGTINFKEKLLLE
tara:strand:- start:40 stop:720 length:681 start_codon:yes stop_codon:yes gene_type:complete